MLAGAYFHADDYLGVLACGSDHLARLTEPEIAALADRHRLREAENAGEGNVDIGEDADLRALDNVAAKTEEVAGAGTAGIDEGGGAALGGEAVCIDAKRSAAPVDVAVQVDEAGRDDAAGGVDDTRGALGRDVGVDRRDPAIGDGEIARRVEAGCRIDEPAALYQEIEFTAMMDKCLPM